MTLRDAVADISVPLTCVPHPVRQPQPAAGRGRQRRGAGQAVLLRQPRHALARRPRDPDGRARRAAGPARAPPAAARRRGAVRARAEAAAAVPARAGSGWSPRPSSAAERDVLENARRRWPDVAFEVAYAAMQGPRAAAEVIEALEPARPRPRRRRDRGRPRRRLGRGPAAVLRRGAGPRRAPAPHPGRLRDRPRAGHAAARPGGRRPRLDPDRRRQAGRPRRRRGAAPGRRRPATGSGTCSPAGWPASRPGSTRCAPGRCSATRAACSTPARDEVDRAARPRPPHPRPRLDRADDDIAHQRARARALSPLATLQRGYAVLQDADGHVVTSVDRASRPATPSASGSPTAGCTPTTTRTEHLEARDGSTTSPRTGARPRRSSSYEAAREELVERRPPARGRRHHPRGVAGALGARRAAGHDLPALARRRPQAAATPRGARRGVGPAPAAGPGGPGVGEQADHAALVRDGGRAVDQHLVAAPAARRTRGRRRESDQVLPPGRGHRARDPDRAPLTGDSST